MFNPAVKGTKGGHFDGCSQSTGTEVIPGTVKIYDSWYANTLTSYDHENGIDRLSSEYEDVSKFQSMGL